MNVIDKIKRKVNGLEISAKITLGYSIFFGIMLVIINVAMWAGVMSALYSPAEKTIQFSMERVKKVFSELEEDYDNYNPNAFRGALVAGVVLRAVDEDRGIIFIDTDETYPPIEKFYEGILLDPPMFSRSDWEVARVGSALVYCAKMNYSHEGRNVTLYFFRTITSELRFFDILETTLLVLDVIGVIFAICVGYFLSRRVLKPIKTMNDLAREIAFEKMEGRIPIGTADDELNRLAKTLNEMLDRLQKGIDRQNEFVANASHDLRQPITAFLGWLSLLKNGGINDPELLNEAIDVLGKESDNMEKLMENISILSRSDRNCLTFRKEILDLSDIVSEIMRSAKVYVEAHTIELISNAPAKIFGNEAAVKQLIRAFLENAVKYTPDGGNIKVNSVVEGDKVLLSIADSGIGIAPENQSKIFDRGFRVDNNSEVKGSGLGLAMAKTIADNHKIKISVDSELGKGTTFTLTIPVADET